MARAMKNTVKRFSLAESDVIEENERILEMGSQKRKEGRVEGGSALAENRDEADKVATSTDSKSEKKATSGIVVNVPLDDYMALMQIKLSTRRPLKELALQAIHEFVERNK